MARINHEQFMVRLLAHIASKPNHGQRELLQTVIALQTEATVEDDPYALFLDRFGDEVAEAVLNLLPEPFADSPADSLDGTDLSDRSPVDSIEGDASCPTTQRRLPASSRTRLTARSAPALAR